MSAAFSISASNDISSCGGMSKVKQKEMAKLSSLQTRVLGDVLYDEKQGCAPRLAKSAMAGGFTCAGSRGRVREEIPPLGGTGSLLAGGFTCAGILF